MSFRKFAILAIAGLTAACGAPPSQSVNPSTLQPATVSNGRVSPDGPCNYVKMEPAMRTIRVHQQLGITPILRYRSAGKCESFWEAATWDSSGGKLLIRKQGKFAIFSSTTPGTYYVTAQVYYGSPQYTGQTTITVNP
ncbi:MAG: hypothetical protein WB615_01260 [Candidatus Tumulicola sp.]